MDSLSELMVDASLGTIQCLEEIVSDSLLLLHHFLFILDHGKQQKNGASLFVRIINRSIHCCILYFSVHLSAEKW